MKFPFTLPALCLLLLAPCFVSAAQEYTSLREVMQDEQLRRDYTVQGEYLTKIDGDSVGLQLIADGKGKFRFVAYIGGLPGDGWKAGDPRFFGTAELDGEEFVFKLTEAKGKFADGKAAEVPATKEGKGKLEMRRPGQPGERPQGQRPQGERPQGQRAPGFGGFRGFPVKIEIPATGDLPAMTFEKTFRTSPTLGKAAPEGATVIFDGTNLDMFKDGAKMNEITFGQQQQSNPRFNTLWAEATTKPFEADKPYTLHLEFMLSFMPEARGQGRSNSGVYIYQSYECQVLDSFGLEGENNECGGFYTIAKPIVNMCAPPLTWQTYDFEFTPPKYDGDKKTANTRLTLKHNGVVIHDNIELPGATPGCLPEGPGARGIYLQGHGNKVQYRNIWIEYK